eukprot:7859383-Pyramimonas_sp.AAC.1
MRLRNSRFPASASALNVCLTPNSQGPNSLSRSGGTCSAIAFKHSTGASVPAQNDPSFTSRLRCMYVHSD